MLITQIPELFTYKIFHFLQSQHRILNSFDSRFYYAPIKKKDLVIANIYYYRIYSNLGGPSYRALIAFFICFHLLRCPLNLNGYGMSSLYIKRSEGSHSCYTMLFIVFLFFTYFFVYFFFSELPGGL